MWQTSNVLTSRFWTASLLIGALVATPASAAEGRFRQVSTQKLLTLDGAWQSRGYGILWHVQKGRVSEYEISGNYCLFREAQDDVPDSAADRMWLDREQKVIRIGVSDGIGYLHAFDRLPRLPEACTKPADRSPMGVFNAVDQIFGTHYAFFERRKIKWTELAAKYRQRVKPDMSDRKLFELISELLGHLGDEHVFMRGEAAGRTLRFTADAKHVRAAPASLSRTAWSGYWSPDAAVRLLGRTARRNSSGSIVYGLIDGEIGYLAVKSLWWRRVSDLDATLDKAIDLFQGAKAVIVDVSNNGGGGEDLGKRVAERFASHRTIGLKKFPGDAKGETPQTIYVEPSTAKRYLGPAYVITSRETFSAAETLAMYMAVLPNVTHIGQPTAGALSDILIRRLPNGWRVGLSNEVYLDAAGRSWEGIGVPPKLALEVRADDDAPAPTAEDLTAVRTVLNTIRTHSRKLSVAN